MPKEYKKSAGFFISLSIHIAILLLIGHIIVMKPEERKAFFEGKIISSKDVNAQKGKPRSEAKLPQDSAPAAVKDIAVPERRTLAVDRPADAPSIGKLPDLAPKEMAVGGIGDGLSSGISDAGGSGGAPGGTLDFSSKARITGKNTRIKGTFVFPISTYSDWDNDTTSVSNLVSELGRRTSVKTSVEYRPIDFKDKKKVFQYPMIYMNGHQAFTFTEEEIANIREYLTRGGFLFVCNDNAQGGIFQEAFYKEVKKIFPESSFQPVPMNHPVLHCFYEFTGSQLPDNLYKNLPTTAYMLYYGDRMVIFYIASGDACDAWAEADGGQWPGTHYTPNASHSFMKLSEQPVTEGRHAGAGEEGIENAFKLGVNVIVYALSNTP